MRSTARSLASSRKRRIERGGVDGLVGEHAPGASRATRARVTDGSAGTPEVVEAPGHLTAEPGDAVALVQASLGHGERGKRERVGHALEPHARLGAQGVRHLRVRPSRLSSASTW